MAATLTADAFVHDAPASSAPTRAHAEARTATVEASSKPHFYDTPGGKELVERTTAARTAALESAPEYKWKDMSNEWDQAHAMGKERATFEKVNAGRDLDGDWKQDRTIHNSNQAFAEHSEEAAMNARSGQAYQAAKEAGRGAEWREAFDLGKEHVAARATYEGAAELAETGAKMLAKDALGMVTEGPVGEAMALRDAVTLAARAPSVGQVVMGSAAGAAAVSVAGALATEVAEHAESSLGIPAEKVSPFVHGVNERIAPAARALDSFHEGVRNFTHEGDAKLEQLGNSISSFAAPVTQPIEHAVNHVAHEAAKAVEPYTAPAAHAISDAFKPLGDALGHVKDSVEHFQAKALQEAVVFALEHRGSASLTSEEAHEVIKALAHVEKGDTLVIENHAIHVVPAGGHMPDLPHDALKLDADTLREGLGIARAPDHAHAASQPSTPAPAAHATAAHEAQGHAMEM